MPTPLPGLDAAIAFLERTESALWRDLEESGALDGTRAGARSDWRALVVHAAIRGVVAARGFADTTAEEVGRLRASLLERWALADAASRLEEFDRLARDAGARGAAGVPRVIGEACARGMGARDAGAAGETLGELHESLAEGVAALLRAAPRA